ncbi:hypothetical protein AVEN_107604-1 [Araneus ventricosus]|uniref:Uncharacterized protein n=1 Tax=Araneus ventricosus TaxID=182803 RepID=A0A4Y2VW42_ARAVE|nr:hypothetical protein AVEN_107604-1 [Araneus ventricosus]
MPDIAEKFKLKPSIDIFIFQRYHRYLEKVPEGYEEMMVHFRRRGKGKKSFHLHSEPPTTPDPPASLGDPPSVLEIDPPGSSNRWRRCSTRLPPLFFQWDGAPRVVRPLRTGLRETR